MRTAMKQALQLILCVFAAAVLVSCGSSNDEAATTATPAAGAATDTGASTGDDVTTSTGDVPEEEVQFDPDAEQQAREAAAAESTAALEDELAEVATQEGAELDGVFVVDVGTATHVETPVDYPTSPGVGGDHSPWWQNCGFYTVPIIEEQGVHSLEHGAVWITYGDTTKDVDKLILETIALKEPYTLVSPFPGQEAPIVMSAWGRQLTLESLDDPLFQQFIDMYREDGPTTPEVGAACSGAYGVPPDDVTTIG